jgi:hypothetical protein
MLQLNVVSRPLKGAISRLREPCFIGRIDCMKPDLTDGSKM